MTTTPLSNTTIITGIGVLGALATAAVLAAAPAEADATTINEIAFIQVIEDRGIPYASEDNAITAAHMVCNDFDNGASFFAEVIGFAKGAEIPRVDAAYFIGASVAAFCPEHEELIHA